MTSRISRPSRLAAPAIVLSVLALAGCTVQKQASAPPFSGPSSLGLTLSLSASPQLLTRDGSSKSTITITKSSDVSVPQRVLLRTTAGTLSTLDTKTDANGTALVQLTAPSINEDVGSAVVTVTPVATDDISTQTSTSRQITISFLGPTVPVPSFTSSPSAPGQYDLVTFDASATTTTTSGPACLSACTYAWDFGDGNTASGQVATHRFSSQGGFNVTLTVTHDGASATKSATVTIGAAQTITAVIAVSPTDPVFGQTVYFDGSGSKTPDGVAITDYEWNFGDGATASGANVSHTYASTVNTYTVRLTVTDALGRTATITTPVKVSKPS